MSDTVTHHIETKKTGRFFTLGNLGSQTNHIWLVLHGYGQLGEFFIRNFKIINNEENFIIAPEALSRFYLNETRHSADTFSHNASETPATASVCAPLRGMCARRRVVPARVFLKRKASLLQS